MVTLTLKQVKAGFFDRKVIQNAIGKVTAENLSKGGNFIKVVAQRSMRYRAGPASAASPPSPAGKPPFARRSSGAKIRKLLFSFWDTSTSTNVTGPIGFGKKEAPTLNEFGGTVTRKRVVRTARRRAGPAQARAYREMVRTGRVTPTPLVFTTYQASYPERRFMGPALSTAIASGKVASVWKDSVKSA